MKAYRQINWLIAATVTVYVLMGYGTQMLGYGELFPFFSWDLFSTIPQAERSDYGLQIVAVNNTPLVEPLYYENAAQWFAQPNSIEAYVLIQSLGNALVSSDPGSTRTVRKQLESIYMGKVVNAEYRIVRRKFDIRQRWLEHRFLSEENLATFSVGIE